MKKIMLIIMALIVSVSVAYGTVTRTDNDDGTTTFEDDSHSTTVNSEDADETQRDYERQGADVKK